MSDTTPAVNNHWIVEVNFTKKVTNYQTTDRSLLKSRIRPDSNMCSRFLPATQTLPIKLKSQTSAGHSPSKNLHLFVNSSLRSFTVCPLSKTMPILRQGGCFWEDPCWARPRHVARTGWTREVLGMGRLTDRKGSKVLLWWRHVGQVKDDMYRAWKRSWMKLLLQRAWLAMASAATSSSVRPKLLCGGRKEGMNYVLNWWIGEPQYGLHIYELRWWITSTMMNCTGELHS